MTTAWSFDTCRRPGLRCALSGVSRSSRDAVDRLTGEIHRLAIATAREAARVMGEAQRALGTGIEVGRGAVGQLGQDLERAERVIGQTARRLAGERTIADRVISLCDVDARPIRRGKVQKPTEFGYKVSIADTAEGLVVAHHVYAGNPADADTLRADIATAKAVGMKVKTVLADRGYGDVIADQALEAEGIDDRVIPRRGRADLSSPRPRGGGGTASVAGARDASAT